MLSLFYNNTTNKKISKIIFSKLLKNTEKILDFHEDKKFELTLVDDKQIQEINKIYRHKNKATDVISFGFNESELMPNEDFLGEIYISLQTASRQAKERKQSLEKELEFLFIHGVLHIFGYDHPTAKDEKIMNGLAFKILGRTKNHL